MPELIVKSAIPRPDGTFTVSGTIDGDDFTLDVRSDADLESRVLNFSAIKAAQKSTAITIGQRTIVVPVVTPPIDPRAGRWIILKSYDPLTPGTPKSLFALTDNIGITLEVRDAPSGGNLLNFTSTVAFPIFVEDGRRRTIWTKRLAFVAGTVSLTFLATKLGTGVFGIDDQTSTQAHAQRQVITVQEV